MMISIMQVPGPSAASSDKKNYTMKQKNNAGAKSADGIKSKVKGESQQSPQKGAPGVSKKSAGKHTKDQSEGAVHNTTKKQQNSI